MVATPIEPRMAPAYSSDRCKIEVRKAGVHAKIPTTIARDAKLGRTRANMLRVNSPLTSTFTSTDDSIGEDHRAGKTANAITRRENSAVKIRGGLQSAAKISKGKNAEETIWDIPYPNPKTLIAESISFSENQDESTRTAEGNVTPQAPPARALKTSAITKLSPMMKMKGDKPTTAVKIRRVLAPPNRSAKYPPGTCINANVSMKAEVIDPDSVWERLRSRMTYLDIGA